MLVGEAKFRAPVGQSCEFLPEMQAPPAAAAGRRQSGPAEARKSHEFTHGFG